MRTIVSVIMLLLSLEAINFHSKMNRTHPKINRIPNVKGDEFESKVVLVTGGSSGIGYTTALEFARHGARVIICSRDYNPSWFNGSAAVKNISTDPQVIAAGGTVRWIKTDVAIRSSVKALFDNILRNEGQLDIAINNAGVCGPIGLVNTVGQYLDSDNDPIRVNLYGTVNCLSEETQYFINAQRNGTIVNVASVNGLIATPEGSLYGASKFGVASLTRSIALEFLSGTPSIRVNAIAPGLINTPLAWNQAKYLENGQQPWEGDLVTPDSDLWKKWGPEVIGQFRAPRIGEPVEMANFILFLSSSAASYISGAVLPADLGDIA